MSAAQGKTTIACREIASSIDGSLNTLIERTIDRHKIPGFKVKDNVFQHSTGGIIRCMGLKGGSKLETRTRLKGLEDVDLGWFEEAESATPEILDIYSKTIRKPGSQQIYTMNRYLEADAVYNRFCVNIDKKTTEHIIINYYDNQFCPKDEVYEAERLKKLDYPHWLHIYGGEPVSQADNSIISRVDLQHAIGRNIKDDGDYSVGADIARFGNDRIVFFKRKGLKTIDWKVYRKKSVDQTADYLMDFTGDKKTPIKVDDTGVGGGVTDILIRNGYNAIPINFGSKPKDYQKYPNKISEMWFEFADQLGKISIPDIRELRSELTSRLYSYDAKQKRLVEPKKEYKKRMGDSPDFADALLLTYYNYNKTTEIDIPKVSLFGA